jgi:hypothetical protein
VTAAGEVGCHTLHAATGKVCSTLLPVEQNVALHDEDDSDKSTSEKSEKSNNLPTTAIGDPIFPQLGDIMAIEVTLRDGVTGALKPSDSVDAKIERVVDTAVASKEYNCVIVHMVVGCKTGHCVPSVACMQKLAKKYPKVVMPVVDACQMRGLTGLSVRRFLELGFSVITTGSKFYGGPPFSGAVLFPKAVADEFESNMKEFPQLRKAMQDSLLKGYLDACMVSDDLQTLQSVLPEKMNFGLLLRWTMALHNIEKVHSIPEERREEIINTWVQMVRTKIRQWPTDALSLLDHKTDGNVADTATEDTQQRRIMRASPSSNAIASQAQEEETPASPAGEDTDSQAEKAKEAQMEKAKANQIYGMGLPRTGTHSLAEALKHLGCRGLNKCVLTRSVVKHVPKSKTVNGYFDVDNSRFRDYQKAFDENPNAKFIVTTREHKAWVDSVKRWDEKNKDRDDLTDIPKIDEFQDEVTKFFVNRRAANQVIFIDLFKMKDHELWSKLMTFVIPDLAKPFDPTEFAFPRSVVQVDGNLTHGGPVVKMEADKPFTSAHDFELLPAQVNSIIPIELKRRWETPSGQTKYTRLSLVELKRVHACMARDCTTFRPAIESDAATTELLTRRMFIAQPVSLNWSHWQRRAYLGVVRIALGASNLIDAAMDENGTAALCEEHDQCMEKLALLLENWEVVKQWEVL